MNQVCIFLCIILLHWFADFVLQTDWQAKNKSTSNRALFEHVASYSMLWFLASIGWAGWTSNWWMLGFMPITFACHFITDYFTSRLNTKLWKAGKVHEFFVSVGFDQVLHYVQLFLTYKLLSGG